MDFSVEKKISNFVETQFPEFYQEEGPNFILFTKAYYEWLESGYAVNKTDKTDIITKEEYYALSTVNQSNYDLQLNAIHQARSIFDLRDIDNTLIDFLEHFQQKYLYGIPFNVIINKRFLLKHILDVYRSKGTIQCYKLLFKLIYNQDIEVYIPGIDLLKPSDGTWLEARYLEVTSNSNMTTYVGKSILGASSNTTAIVESFITETINKNFVSTLFISNIQPRGGTFVTREKVIPTKDRNNPLAVINAPTIVGSVDRLKIVNGGLQFSVGDIIKLAHRDVKNGKIISNGIDSRLKVTGIGSSTGSIPFDILRGGFGFTANSQIFIYKGENDITGAEATFDLGPLSNNRRISYNTDIIVDYKDLTLDATAYGFPLAPAANLTSAIGPGLHHNSMVFGTIATLDNIDTGENYTNSVINFVRTTQVASNALPGTITYSTTSNSIVGVGTMFQGNEDAKFFEANDVIYLQANSSDLGTIEYQVIKSVESNTHITLYAPPINNSTDSSIYKHAPVTLPSNYAAKSITAIDKSIMYRADNTINGENEIISGLPNIANGVITGAVALDSGKGYSDNEPVVAYLFNGLQAITIINGGTGYANGELLQFIGGNTVRQAVGYITTDENGVINAAIMDYAGSNYKSIPKVKVRTISGTGAILTTNISEFNTHSKVKARVVKSGVGRKEGYWSTTRGQLNSDKYIQDSYFYQDYSYQIKAGVTLDKYKDILYNTFHVAGSELFGKVYLQFEENSIDENIKPKQDKILYEMGVASNLVEVIPLCDTTLIGGDNQNITIDLIP
jgi:hypothetical protein